MKKQTLATHGFIFAPLLFIIGALIIGAGGGIIANKAFSSHVEEQKASIAEVVLDNENTYVIAESDLVQETELNNQEALTKDSQSNTTEITKNTHVNTIIPSQQKTPVVQEITEHKVDVPLLSTKTQLESNRVDGVLSEQKNEVVQVPVIDTNKITYDQVKRESLILKESIATVREQYKQKEQIMKQSLDICTTKYQDGIAQAKSDAEYLKTTYSESRSGYASSPSVYDDVDAALEYDLRQIEIQFKYCKSQYQLDTSIKSSIDQIERKHNNLMLKLSLDNASESLNTIRDLSQELLNVADRLW